jgi:hypothetical protein
MTLLAAVEATWTDVLRVSSGSPEVAEFTETIDREFFLNEAGIRFFRSVYGDFTVGIQAYAAAHFAQMAKTEAAGLGPASSESIGGVSGSNTLPAHNTDETWGETIYGRAVKKIMMQRRPNMLVANPSVV